MCKTREELKHDAFELGLDLNYTPEVVIENIFECGEEEWQKTMRDGIGSSGAASALGKSKYKTAAEVALEKTYGGGKPIGNDADTQYRLNSGHMQEVPLLKWYAAKLGYVIALSDPRNPSTSDIKDVSEITEEEWKAWEGFGVVCVDHARYRHPDFKFMFTDMDGICFTPSREKYVLECKTADFSEFDWNWKSGVWPNASVGNPGYIDQARHHMCVSNTDRCDIIASCGFNAAKNVVVTVYRDMTEERKLIDGEAALWKKVEDGVIPSFTTLSERSFENVAHIVIPNDLKEDPIQLADAMRDTVDEILSIQREIKDYEAIIDSKNERINALSVQVLLNMGDHKIATIPSREGYEIRCELKSRKTVTFDRKRYELENPEEAVQYLKVNFSDPKLSVAEKKIKKQ